VDSTLISFLEIFEGFSPFSVFLLSGHLESKPLRMSHHFLAASFLPMTRFDGNKLLRKINELGMKNESTRE
jgi:hypothetical protein